MLKLWLLKYVSIKCQEQMAKPIQKKRWMPVDYWKFSLVRTQAVNKFLWITKFWFSLSSALYSWWQLHTGPPLNLVLTIFFTSTNAVLTFNGMSYKFWLTNLMLCMNSPGRNPSVLHSLHKDEKQDRNLKMQVLLNKYAIILPLLM